MVGEISQIQLVCSRSRGPRLKTGVIALQGDVEIPSSGFWRAIAEGRSLGKIETRDVVNFDPRSAGDIFAKGVRLSSSESFKNICRFPILGLKDQVSITSFNGGHLGGTRYLTDLSP